MIAWLWARTVRSPDPAVKGAMVPLVSNFLLSTKEGKKAWAVPVIDPTARDGYRFEVRTGKLAKADEEKLKKGTIGAATGGLASLPVRQCHLVTFAMKDKQPVLAFG